MFPSNWSMNRLISIALRRTLGKYFILQDSELLQGLESDLVNGRVVLSGLVLDPSAWSVPLEVFSGHLERVEIALSTPLSLSSSISISLSGLHLSLKLPSDLDLAASFYSAEDSLAEAEDSLAEDLAESISQDLPGAFSSSSGASSTAPEAGLIQRLIERLLTRVSVQVNDISIQLGIEGAELEVRLPGFTCTAEEDRSRVVSFFGLGVYYRASREKMHRTDSGDSSGDLAMSMAIADLRSSQVEESVYLSAGEESDEDKQQKEENDWIQLLSFGADPLGLKLTFESGTMPSSIDIIVGHITLLLSPDQITTFLALKLPASKSTSASPSPSPSASPSVKVTASIKSFTLFLTYASTDPSPKFWHKPTSPHLLTPHLRFRLHKLSYSHSAIRIADLSLLEFDGALKPVLTLDAPVYDLVEADEDSTEDEWRRAFPVVERSRKGEGIECRLAEEWEVDVPPVCCVVDLDLLRRCEGLLDVFTSYNSEKSGEEGAASPATSVTIKCPLIRVEVSCAMPEDPLGVLTLDLHGLDLSTEEGVKASFAGLVLSYTGPTESARAFCSISSTCTAVLLPLSKIDLPVVLLDLDKPLLDGIQIWADKITQYFQKDEAVIGDKFLGKSLSQASEESEYKMDVTITVPKVVIRLTCSTMEPGRVIQVLGHHTTLKFRTRKSDQHDNVIAGISIDRLTMEDLSLKKYRQVLGRSIQSSTPMLAVHFDSRTSVLGVKKSKVTLDLSDLAISLSTDLTWVGEVIQCLQPPEGVFASAVPADSTELSFGLSNISLHIRSATACAFLLLDSCEYKTKLAPNQPTTLSSIKTRTIRLLLGEKDDAFAPTVEEKILDTWHNRGYVDIANLDSCTMEMRRNGTVLPELEGRINNTGLKLSLCPDSLATLSALGSEIGSIKISEPVKKSRSSPATSSLSSSRSAMIGSVDYTAFSASKVQDTPMDLVDDDIPANGLYLNATSGTAKSRQKGKTSLPNSNGECISILDPAAFRLEEGYLTAERYRDEISVASRACLMRINIESDLISLRLHEGYDWLRTRSAIRTEVKMIRRKLLRVRQMLASGQKADVADTSTTLFNSVVVGLPLSEDLSDEQLVAAIDEELFDTQEDETWENVQPAKEKGDPVKSTARRSALTPDLSRSEKAAIEIILAGLKLSITTFPPSHTTASELRVSARTFEILDNIKTSTWHKFLTELRIGDGGHSRPPEEPMLRVLFTQMRSSRASAALEARLKVKIAPLRLHVDQDAVDFLKRFGSYKDPMAVPASSPPVESFIQRVEIFPVKIKLDYKPKRVDYVALKGGKTSELMNFFHFDGSEMTLRYISLSDITGWSRISDMLQDIWTPDVKANQLASVLAGIAPIRSVVNVGSGMADLVLLPIDQYRKDGRVLRGLQKGATSFSKSSALEALRLGARLATGTQVILEKAESVIGARIGSTLNMEAVGPDAQRSRYASQPKTAAAGFKGAYEDLGDNLRTTAQTILAVPMEVYERSATDGSVKAVLRAIPVAILHPAIGASSAVSKTLMGLTNQLDPSDLARQSDKWRS